LPQFTDRRREVLYTLLLFITGMAKAEVADNLGEEEEAAKIAERYL
jgi:hypothetical protein